MDTQKNHLNAKVLLSNYLNEMVLLDNDLNEMVLLGKDLNEIGSFEQTISMSAQNKCLNILIFMPIFFI